MRCTDGVLILRCCGCIFNIDKNPKKLQKIPTERKQKTCSSLGFETAVKAYTNKLFRQWKPRQKSFSRLVAIRKNVSSLELNMCAAYPSSIMRKERS